MIYMDRAGSPLRLQYVGKTEVKAVADLPTVATHDGIQYVKLYAANERVASRATPGLYITGVSAILGAKVAVFATISLEAGLKKWIARHSCATPLPQPHSEAAVPMILEYAKHCYQKVSGYQVRAPRDQRIVVISRAALKDIIDIAPRQAIAA